MYSFISQTSAELMPARSLRVSRNAFAKAIAFHLAHGLLATLLPELKIHSLVQFGFSSFFWMARSGTLSVPARNAVTSASIHSTPW